MIKDLSCMTLAIIEVKKDPYIKQVQTDRLKIEQFKLFIIFCIKYLGK